MYNEINWEEIHIELAPPAEEPKRQYYYMKKLRQWMKGKKEELGRPLKAAIQTFGCQMNARDSEKITGILEQIGYRIVQEEEGADFVLYNTCTVRENANLRVYGRLGQLKNEKKNNPDMMLALCGCMMQEEQVVERIRKSYRNVDIIFGTHNIYKLAELIYERIQHEGQRNPMVVDIWEDTDCIVEELPNQRKFPFKGGVNIMFGCNNFCSYCIVPYVRGRERSREVQDILDEIRGMAADGVVEVMLLGQNVNSYGKNLANPVSFAKLLQEVEKIPGLERIRFMTSHPKDLSDELIAVMANSSKICRHLHLPMQSGSSRILKKMNRCYDKEGYLALVERIRTAIPDIALTTDIIVGFPGESDEDFLETMDVVERVRFDSAYTFLYSKRSGTPAAKMDGQIPKAKMKERFDTLLSRVQTIAAEVAQKHVGQIIPVLVEAKNDHDANMVTGRSDDNYLVHFVGDESLIGQIVPVKIVESKGFYYMGVKQ